MTPVDCHKSVRPPGHRASIAAYQQALVHSNILGLCRFAALISINLSIQPQGKRRNAGERAANRGGRLRRPHHGPEGSVSGRSLEFAGGRLTANCRHSMTPDSGHPNDCCALEPAGMAAHTTRLERLLRASQLRAAAVRIAAARRLAEEHGSHRSKPLLSIIATHPLCPKLPIR